MTPPTNIDGTDITGATIDGQEVTEITIDGVTVFSPLPVAFSNLIAWYPFDSQEYGGSDTDDVTAIIGGSGDDTAFNQNITGNPSFPASGGVTDINAGTNSGAVDFSGQSGAELTNSTLQLDDTDDFTITAWAEKVGNVEVGGTAGIVAQRNAFDTTDWILFTEPNDGYIGAGAGEQNASGILEFNTSFDGSFLFVAFVKDDSNYELYAGSGTTPVDSLSYTGGWTTSETLRIGNLQAGNFTLDGAIDDVRIYNKPLSGSEINQIYLRTQP
jgi:hypothetical protein